jgi:hypothetical protein
MKLCQKTFIPFSKSEIKIEKALQSQVKTIIAIQNYTPVMGSVRVFFKPNRTEAKNSQTEPN